MNIAVKRTKDIGLPQYEVKTDDGFCLEFSPMGKLLRYDGHEHGAENVNFKAVREDMLKDLLIEHRPELKEEDLIFNWIYE